MLFQLYTHQLKLNEIYRALSYVWKTRSVDHDDLIDYIVNIDPFDTPFVLSKAHTFEQLHEWQFDTLRKVV